TIEPAHFLRHSTRVRDTRRPRCLAPQVWSANAPASSPLVAAVFLGPLLTSALAVLSLDRVDVGRGLLELRWAGECSRLTNQRDESGNLGVLVRAPSHWVRTRGHWMCGRRSRRV